MRRALWVVLPALAACVDPIPLDQRPCPCADGWTCNAATQLCEQALTAAPDAAPWAGPAYHHTIMIDGLNDFFPSKEGIYTTSDLWAFVSWDADYLYVAYESALVPTGDAT